MKEVGKYMEGYDACQRYKNQSEAPAGKLMPNMIPEKPWSHISVDFITKLPLAQGYDAILVVCNHLSKMVHFIATTEKTSAEGLAKIFQDHIWKLHGLCHKLHLVISPPFLRRFPRSQSQLKALKKTFRSIRVMSRGNQ